MEYRFTHKRTRKVINIGSASAEQAFKVFSIYPWAYTFDGSTPMGCFSGTKPVLDPNEAACFADFAAKAEAKANAASTVWLANNPAIAK